MSTFGQYGFKHFDICKGFVGYLPSRQVPPMTTILHRFISLHIHPKLCNANLHNVMPTSLISQKPRERMFIGFTPYCHIFLPCITKFVINANHQRKLTHTLALRHVSTCKVSSSSFHVTCWILVHASATSPGKTKWSGPH